MRSTVTPGVKQCVGAKMSAHAAWPALVSGQLRFLGKRGFIHVELWRLGWDGLQGGFCGEYREYLQENQRSRAPKPGDHEPR